LLDRWLPGRFQWDALRSSPFVYLVMRDSLLDEAALFAHHQRIADSVAREQDSGNYLGLTLGVPWSRVPVPDFVDPSQVVAAARTEEVAIDLAAFRNALCAGVQSLPEIDIRYGCHVERVQRSAEGFVVHAVGSEGGRCEIASDVVVNCLWDGRLGVDRQLGVVSRRQQVYRLKYRVLAELPPSLGQMPPLSLVLGQYGDVVPLSQSSYLSWYPVCRRGWSSALSPPSEWVSQCAGEVPADVAHVVASETLAALDAVIPGVAKAHVTGVDAGVVVAWGVSDIDRRDSELHERHAIGVHAHDGYFSVDTGKLVCAPYFAQQLATMV
jgi:hypothetical protein